MSEPWVLAVTIPGKPQPKERARKGKWGKWYTPSKTRKYMDVVQRALVVAANAHNKQHGVIWSLTSKYVAELSVYWPDKRRRDSDNVVKGVLDAANKVLWADDSQCRAEVKREDIDRARPRLELVVRDLQRQSRERDPGYLAFVREHDCCLCGKRGPSEAHHWAPKGQGGKGMGRKCDDAYTVPLCLLHHRHWHDQGHLPGLTRAESELLFLEHMILLLAADRKNQNGF